MPRYIEEEAFVKWVEEHFCNGCNNYGGIKCKSCSVDDAISMVESAPTADVVPKAELANAIVFDMASRLHQMLPFKASSFINGEPIGNGVDFGKEKAIYEMLNYLSELQKKYAEAKDTNAPTKVSSGEICVACGESVPKCRRVCSMCEIGQEFFEKRKG